MQHRPLGRTGRSISALGLGCMGMSEFYGERDDAQSLKTLEAALDLGIDFLDTADMYGFGDNEELIGRFLKEGGRRERVTLATKFAVVRQRGSTERRIDNTPAYLRAACEASLRRLGIDTIDLYYCHRRDPAVPVEEMVGEMARLVEEGKVRALGLSEVSVETLRAAHAVHPITAVQTEYSLWFRDPEAKLIPACRELGVTFVPYSPLGRAFLTGKVKTDELAATDFRRVSPRFQGEALAHNQEMAAGLARFAEARGLTPAQVALAWILNKQPDAVPIPGTKRVAYLAENVVAAEVKLSAEEIAELDALFPPGAAQGGRYAEGGTSGIEAI